ncbi:histidine phosphatase family protein [Halochromatium roseum]|uniref:histidine phosphatase family protein n=1 Tax=Halochromatium roseum TaxID=391920 RepID=UPI001913A969|nr:histidine phosphatase family protein [Halochromatium roseum]MBK5940362.1 hypothetical protein [Halochromatium roseum]
MITLIIARHGNTFDHGDTLLRCGARTDLPLSASGQRQARALGRELQQRFQQLDAVYVSRLQRTQQTAALALEHFAQSVETHVSPALDEIDYGPDEGQPESTVLARLGPAALARWDQQNIVPPGWHCEPDAMMQRWRDFLTQVTIPQYRGARILAVTSNGTARFLPEVVTRHASCLPGEGFKLATGAYALLQHQHGEWAIDSWNLRPERADKNTSLTGAGAQPEDNR